MTNEIKFIQDVFSRIKRVEQAKYQKAQQMRQVIWQKINNNQNVESYRLEFIKESVDKLFTFMDRLGKEFNKSYPDDKFTMNDVGDILASGLNLLQKNCNI